jgi:hypothetical protein
MSSSKSGSARCDRRARRARAGCGRARGDQDGPHRAVAALPLTVMSLFALALWFGGGHHPHERGAIAIAVAVGVILPGIAAAHFLATARRLRRIARAARDDASLRWFCRRVIVAARDDVPRSERTFVIERSPQKQLTAVPGARLLP